MLIEFHLTNNCNLKCSYCYQHYKGHENMSIETGKKIIDSLFPYIDKTIYGNYFGNKTTIDESIEFSFFGGEALLALGIIDEVMDYFVKIMPDFAYDYVIEIGTNGLLLNTKKVKAFTEKWLNHVKYDITLDGDKTLHDACRKFENGQGSYDIVYENFMAYNKAYGNNVAPLNAKMTLSPDNIQYFSDGYKFLDNLGMSILFNFACGVQHEWTDEKLNIAKQEISSVKEYILDKYNNTDKEIKVFDDVILSPQQPTSTCGTEGNMISIDWNGDIYFCQMFSSTSISEKHSFTPYGNVYKQINQYNASKVKLSISQRQVLYPAACDGCRAKYRLCEQCPAESYELFEDMNKIDTRRCAVTKILLHEIDNYRDRRIYKK